MIDPHGVIVLVNREVERLFAYSREEMLGRPVEMLVPERFRAGHPGFRGGFFIRPSVRSMGAGRDLFGLRKDGSEVPVEIGLTPVVTEEGLFVISSIVDITARRRAEERFRVAVESSPNGMLMLDQSGKILLVNREIERIFGYAREELLGNGVETLVPPRFRTRHPDDRAAFFANPKARIMGAGRELFGLHKSGGEVPVEIGINPIETDEGLFVLASVTDISARKRAEEDRRKLEEQLRQAQKMEAVGTLAGGVAHEFNNVLGSIVGFSELIRSATNGLDGVQSDVNEILAAAERGRQIVDRILAFSRRTEPSRRPLALGQFVTDSAKLLRAALPASIEVDVQVRPGSPRIAGDPTSIQQVLMNLGTNAAHAMPAGGRLEIAVDPFYVRDSFARARPDLHEGHYAVLSVRDSGEGMDRNVLSRVLEPFFTTKELGRGSGLGLAIVHGIMREHEGMLELESEVGRGTTVKCYFPALFTDQVEVVRVEEETQIGKGEHILFVDDEPQLVRVGERRLRNLGYEVTVASDGFQGLEILRTTAPGRFQLVVTDFSMPRMSGLEFAREAVKLHPNVPVLLLTGFIEELPADLVAAAGVKMALKKPVTVRELANAVRELIAGPTAATNS
jgi:PAS domain S-box-containing protein